MSEDNKPDNLEGLIQNTSANIRQQQDKASALADNRSKPSPTKKILAFASLATFAALLYFQYPRIIAPYALPDPNTDPTVIEGELVVVSELIEAYKLSQGRYPESLGNVKLLPALGEGVDISGLSYQLKDSGYVLDWQYPKWHGKLNSVTGEIAVTPTPPSK
jgi:hypothetical protein